MRCSGMTISKIKFPRVYRCNNCSCDILVRFVLYVQVIVVVLVRILLSRIFNAHHLVLLDEAFPASFWQRSIMMAEKRLLQDIETGVVGDSDTDEAKVMKPF